MDAQNRGQGEIDPADQWVLNPETGNYELRLDNPAAQPPSPRSGEAPPRRDASGGAPRDSSGEAGGRAGRRQAAARGADAPARRKGAPDTADLPGQRSRRKGAAAAPPPSRRKGKGAKKSGKKKALLWTSGVLGFLVLATSGGAYAYYQHLNSNISTIDVGGAGSQSSFAAGKPVNILLMGTDKRTGAGNEGYGDAGSVGHADTNILLHVSADRTNATALSIPRDLITDIPDCETKEPNGETKVIPGTPDTRFNTSLGQDGRDPGCAMRTVQELTGVKVDHFMMADFNAVKTLSTAVGGVPICVAHAVDDPKSHLKLTAGEHTIEGEQALAFVRTRHSFGTGSDLSRIQVQQQFLSALLRQLKSKDTLSSPTKLASLAEAATKALTVDTGIGSIKKLSDLARELSKVNPKNITFATLPVVDNPAEKIVHATVVVNEAEAQPIFDDLQNDSSLTEVKKKSAPADSVLKGTKAAADDVRVDVYNGGAADGSAQSTLAWFQNDKQAPKTTNKGDAGTTVDKTTLEYAPNQADQARTVAAWMGLPASALKKGTKDAVGLQAMKLTLGKDFKGAGVPLSGPAKVSDNVQRVEADKQVCAK
ncbi:LCP family protein [Streptomyces fuscigenes]|uniref:LCP family protein n=1 Tax=Streptomyces fuscigenes TaxID=1528880 RepID=UPI001F21AD9F|nr:LCP family protein [Streptomyces fuscigenes]MCF3960645.1 LCP family protein [Streptomyces fuscigenes]